MTDNEKITRKSLEDKTLEQLADEMAHPQTSYRPSVASAELKRRLAIWQREAVDAQIKTAEYTLKSAMWIKWSVVAIFITSGAQAFFAFLAWYNSKLS